MKDIESKDIQVARIVNNSDPEFMLLELAKSRDATFSVQPGDEFLTVVFVRQGNDGKPEIWNPFE